MEKIKKFWDAACNVVETLICWAFVIAFLGLLIVGFNWLVYGVGTGIDSVNSLIPDWLFPPR